MAGKYVVEVSDGTWNDVVLKNDKLVVVDFWATWCGPCVALAPTMDQLAEEYNGKVIIAKMNVDQNRSTPASLGITSIPTIMIYKNGARVEALVGGGPKAKFKSAIDKHL